MSPAYRRPDPWTLAHRRAIRWTAGAVFGGSILAFAKLPAVWNIPLVITMIADFLLWVWLSGRYSPSGADYYDFLMSKAEEIEMAGWLIAEVDREFCELWDIPEARGVFVE
jgi:hypothetical protein